MGGPERERPRDVAQAPAADPVEMGAVHDAGLERLFDPGDVLRVAILENDVDGAVGGDPQDAVTDDAGDPHPALGVEGHAVREGPGAELGDRPLVEQAAAVGDIEGGEAAGEGFVDEEPLAIGTGRHLKLV